MKRCFRWTIGPLVLLLVIAPVAKASVIVLDPTNLAVNLEQVAHHLEVIARLDQQIRNQLRMLENWEFTRLEELLASIGRVQAAVEGIADLDVPGLYSTASGDYARRDSSAMAELRQQRLTSHREAVVQAQRTQSQVVSEIPETQQRIREYLQRARQAPGQTAVLQASNETIATLAAQLQHLQAIDLADARVELEAEALRQARATFHRQRRNALMNDWSAVASFAVAPRLPVRSPFGNR